jgi:hypothetical protein
MTNENYKYQQPSITNELPKVTSTTRGSVTKPSWNAQQGYAEQRQQREELNKQYEQAQPSSLLETRLLLMEGAIADLQKRLAALEKGDVQ